MSDRRRSLFILLLVVGLLAGSLAAIATKSTRLGLDLKGGVQLVYQAKGTAQEAKGKVKDTAGKVARKVTRATKSA